MVKKFVIIIIVSISLLCAMFVYRRGSEYFSDVYMKIAILSVGSNEKVYYYVIKKDGTLISKSGSSWTDNVNSLFFMKKVEEIIEFKLTKQEFQEINELLENVKKNPSKLGWVDRKLTYGPPGMISLRYNFKGYSGYYAGDNPDPLSMLIEKLCELSNVTVMMGNY